jgi:hypothetical protein
LGTAATSALFLVTILSLVTYLTVSGKDVLPTPNTADAQELTA